MTPLERWQRVAPTFTAVVEAVPDDSWERDAPCDGWVARDVVRHLVEWVPAFLADGSGIEVQVGPSVDADPVGAWKSLAEQLEGLVAPSDPPRSFSHPRAGDHPLDAAIDQFITSDVLVHTWDLATATGQQVELDQELAAQMADGIEPITDMLAASGQYGEPKPVPDDADPTTRLIALTGRDPAWQRPS